MIACINRYFHNFIDISVKKVLFIIVDGIPADTIENLTLPNIQKIAKIGKYKRAYVETEIGIYYETPTISAPGYMNLITGTWANKHNVYDNEDQNPNYNYKNIFRLVKEQQSDKKIGIYSTWTDNRVKLVGEGLFAAGNIKFDYKFDGYEFDNITYPHDPEDFYIHQIDQRVSEEASKSIKNDAPDLSWVYLQYTDDIGHMYGDSEQMNQAVKDMDKKIGQIYESIEYRMEYHKEDWLIIITTDHGRDSETGKEHGEQTERERTTWIVTNRKEANTYFEDFQPTVVDIYPTMTRFLNITIPTESERELDGIALTGKVSLAKPDVSLVGDSLTIKWKALDTSGNVTVWLSRTNLFKDGLIDNYEYIGSVPVKNEMCIFDIEQYSSSFYKIVLEGQYNMVNRWIYRS